MLQQLLKNDSRPIYVNKMVAIYLTFSDEKIRTDLQCALSKNLC